MSDTAANPFPAISDDAAVARSQIVGFEQALRDHIASTGLTDTTHAMPLQHHFIPGVYARELTIPAGTVLVGKIHKHPCFNIVSKGSISVISEEGKKRIDAPAFFRSEAGIKRIGYAHTDTVWTTIHRTDETDPELAVEQITVASYEELDLIANTPTGAEQ